MVPVGTQQLALGSTQLGWMHESDLSEGRAALQRRLDTDGYLLLRELISPSKVQRGLAKIVTTLAEAGHFAPGTDPMDRQIAAKGQERQSYDGYELLHSEEVLNVLEADELHGFFSMLWGEAAGTFDNKWFRAVGPGGFSGFHMYVPRLVLVVAAELSLSLSLSRSFSPQTPLLATGTKSTWAAAATSYTQCGSHGQAHPSSSAAWWCWRGRLVCQGSSACALPTASMMSTRHPSRTGSRLCSCLAKIRAVCPALRGVVSPLLWLCLSLPACLPACLRACPAAGGYRPTQSNCCSMTRKRDG